MLFALLRSAQAVDDLAKRDIRVEIERQAVRLSEQLFTTYRQYDHNRFSDLISGDFLPSKSEFINAVEAGLAENTVVDARIASIFVLPSVTKLAARVKWEKKIVNKDTGDLKLITGNALFVFQQEKNNWKLLRVKGDNPF
jgi:hypothetical protein